MAKVINDYHKRTGSQPDFRTGDIIAKDAGTPYIVAHVDNASEFPGEHLYAAISLSDGNRWDDPIEKSDFTQLHRGDGFELLKGAALTITKEDV